MTRRWLPEGGEKKLKEKIHRESKFADDHKNLPFSFSKPKKSGKMICFQCVECGRVVMAGINAVMCICPDCKKVTKVEKVEEL
jgi:uncharacterized OB-fold protein